ncbi:MAG: Ig-like domain-containing protein [Ignavibacterium sp.]|nr:MAG: Ig-like domain-containing protein [Ignavibacterium sp.]
MNRTIIFTLLFISLIFLGTISATSHYVDKDATGSNNGSSWANAWQSFSSINWSSVRPGDVIYISGGSSSKIYYETLTINANGSANNLITIRNGLNSGHNGRVVIDGGSRRKGIVISGDKYIRVAGLETQYCDENILIDGTANVIYLDSLGIYHFRGHGGVKINGHTSSGANDRIDSIFVRYCDMVHLDNVSDQTDVFYTQYGIRHLFIIDNYIKMKNNHIPSAHSDLFHFDHQTMDITISGNTIIGLSDGISGMKNNGLIAGEVKGDVYFYNNVLYYPTADLSGQNVFTQFDDGYESTWYIYSNTFIGGTTPNLFKIEDTDCTIKNNIFYGDASRSSPHIIFRHFPSASYTHNDWSKIDYNVYGNNVTGSSIINISGRGGVTMATFNGLGGETGGTPSARNKVNPLLVDIANEDFSLQSSSPAIDEGLPLGTPYSFDIEGVSRPQGAGWDIGAYEILNGPDVTSPKLQGALINNPIQVALSFSESLDSQSAQNESNYSIDNGINVLSASLSSNNRDVTLTTSEHSPNQQYTVTVINVKDLAGNTISSQANSAQYLLEADTSPPELISAEIKSLTEVQLFFSESLDSQSAENVNNYNIDNGIGVIDAVLNGIDTDVTLTTSQHNYNQQYTITVINLTDLAGNTISSTNNSALYKPVEIIDPLFPVDLFGTVETEKTVLCNVVKPSQITDSCLFKLTAFDPDHGGIDPPEGHVFINGNGPLELFPGATQANGDGQTNDFTFLVPASWWTDGENELHFIRLYSTGFKIDTVVVEFNDGTQLLELQDASLNNDTTLILSFSKEIEMSSATDINNYIINNNIIVLTAAVISDNKTVKLNTSIHSEGAYEIIINNVKDLDGNLISPNSNSAIYEYIPLINQTIISVKLFLEGPFVDNRMILELNSNSLIPSVQPYNRSPWNYPGNESLNNLNPDIVDWILLELRINPEASSKVLSRAVLLRSDGFVTDTDGLTTITFSEVPVGSYYIVIHHRNHLSIMSKNPVLIDNTPQLYDFTLSQEKAYGNEPMKALGSNIYGLYSSDGNGNGVINNSDKNSVWKRENGSFGYYSGDFDLNGGVNVADRNSKWRPNKGRHSQIP